MSAEPVERERYWFDQTEHERGVRILEAMRLYRAAESAMRRRTQDSMSMGENDLLALRFLIRGRQRGRDITPTDLANYLGVKTSSITALLDRLESGGHLRRVPSPFDRRRTMIEPTDHADAEVRKTLDQMHERMIAATTGIDAAGGLAIVEFLERMRDAVDAIDAA